MAPGFAAAVAWACILIFSASFSGALSWTKSASFTASSIVLTNFSRSCEAPGFRPTLVSAGQALATFKRIEETVPRRSGRPLVPVLPS